MAHTENDDTRLLRNVAVALVVVFVAALAHAGLRAWTVAGYERAPAEIVEVEARRGTGNQASTRLVPIAVLALPSEARRRVALERSSNSPFCCDPGERVEVLYDAEDVEGTATVDRVTELYGVQLLVAAVAGLFLLPLGVALRGTGRT
jgi:hypothetical protein